VAKAKKIKRGSPRNLSNLAKTLKRIAKNEEILKKLKEENETYSNI
jgi:hypothetical protein